MATGDKPVGWSHLHPEDSSEFPIPAQAAPAAPPAAQAAPQPAAAPPAGSWNQGTPPPVGAFTPAAAGGSPSAPPHQYPPQHGVGVPMNPQNPPQSAPPPRAQAQPPAGSAAQRVGGDEVLYEGLARHTASIGSYLKWALVGVLGGLGGWGLGHVEFFASWPLWVLSLAGIPGMIWTYLRHVTTKFKITHRRVEYERGVLSKDVDSLELWRVLDVRFKQSLIDRILGNARIVLIGTDQSDPELQLYGLPGSRALFERLRDAVQAARHTSRPMEVVGQDGAMENFGMGDISS